MDFPLQTNHLGYTGWAPQDSVQLPKNSGWILWFMVDIAVVNGYHLAGKQSE
jgi:hypothetical protein